MRRGERHEETAIHEYHECPTIREGVWRPLAKVWLAATGDTINVESPLLTVAGLRLAPATLAGEARKRFVALEPAWRLLHSVTLLQLHRARTRLHMAYHAHPRHDARRAEPKDPHYNQCLHCHSQCGPLASTLSGSVGLWPTTLSGNGTTVRASGPHSQWEWMTVVFGTSPAGRVRASLSAPKRPKVAPKRASVLPTCSSGHRDPHIFMGEAHSPPMPFVLPFVRLGREPLSTTLSGSVGLWPSL